MIRPMSVPAQDHEHEWQPGPVLLEEREYGVRNAVSVMAMCRCGEWRSVKVVDEDKEVLMRRGRV